MNMIPNKFSFWLIEKILDIILRKIRAKSKAIEIGNT